MPMMTRMMTLISKTHSKIFKRVMKRCHLDLLRLLHLRRQLLQLLLRSKHWDSRVAAGDCLGLIAEHCVHHSAAELQRAAGSAAAAQPEPDGFTE